MSYDPLLDYHVPGRTILVWRYEDAPQAFRDLTSDDDKDWVAWIPAGHPDERYIPWAHEGGAFGCYRVEEFSSGDGTVLIGAHA